MVPNNWRRSGTCATPDWTIAGVGRRAIERPSKRMSPPARPTMPMTVFSSVLLPAPFAPISATISPSATCSETSRSTGVRP